MPVQQHDRTRAASCHPYIRQAGSSSDHNTGTIPHHHGSLSSSQPGILSNPDNGRESLTLSAKAQDSSNATHTPASSSDTKISPDIYSGTFESRFISPDPQGKYKGKKGGPPGKVQVGMDFLTPDSNIHQTQGLKTSLVLVHWNVNIRNMEERLAESGAALSVVKNTVDVDQAIQETPGKVIYYLVPYSVHHDVRSDSPISMIKFNQSYPSIPMVTIAYLDACMTTSSQDHVDVDESPVYRPILTNLPLTDNNHQGSTPSIPNFTIHGPSHRELTPLRVISKAILYGPSQLNYPWYWQNSDSPRLAESDYCVIVTPPGTLQPNSNPYDLNHPYFLHKESKQSRTILEDLTTAYETNPNLRFVCQTYLFRLMQPGDIPNIEEYLLQVTAQHGQLVQILPPALTGINARQSTPVDRHDGPSLQTRPGEKEAHTTSKDPQNHHLGSQSNSLTDSMHLDHDEKSPASQSTPKALDHDIHHSNAPPPGPNSSLLAPSPPAPEPEPSKPVYLELGCENGEDAETFVAILKRIDVLGLSYHIHQKSLYPNARERTPLRPLVRLFAETPGVMSHVIVLMVQQLERVGHPDRKMSLRFPLAWIKPKLTLNVMYKFMIAGVRPDRCKFDTGAPLTRFIQDIWPPVIALPIHPRPWDNTKGHDVLVEVFNREWPHVPPTSGYTSDTSIDLTLD